jgi:hypothetical protein
VQVWNIDTDSAEELCNVMLPRRSWAELESGVREAFKVHWTAANEGKFALYYITELSQPVLSKVKVSSQPELDVYLAFRASSQRLYTQLFLHVAIIFQANGKPVSPVKPPLTINTALARAADRGVVRQASRSTSHLSPDDVGSPLSPHSPGTPREKEFRQVVLARDSDGCVRPDVAKLRPSVEQRIFRCVFCQESFMPLRKQVEAAHVVPHADYERLGVPVPLLLQLLLGGGFECVANGISACSTCHGQFDDGLMWVEVAADASLSIAVDETIRTVAKIGVLHGRPVRLPHDVALHSAFPCALAWRWRKEWAACKRQHDADVLAKKLEALEVKGIPKVPCRCGRGVVRKTCDTGPDQSPLCKQCCLSTGTACKSHQHQSSCAAPSPASASSSSSSAAASLHPARLQQPGFDHDHDQG